MEQSRNGSAPGVCKQVQKGGGSRLALPKSASGTAALQPSERPATPSSLKVAVMPSCVRACGRGGGQGGKEHIGRGAGNRRDSGGLGRRDGSRCRRGRGSAAGRALPCPPLLWQEQGRSGEEAPEDHPLR